MNNFQQLKKVGLHFLGLAKSIYYVNVRASKVSTVKRKIMLQAF